jgi:adenylate cyclase
MSNFTETRKMGVPRQPRKTNLSLNVLQPQTSESKVSTIENTEIERKWLFAEEQFKDIQKNFTGNRWVYEQSYLSINPEIRIRRKQKVDQFLVAKEPATYKLCIKSKGTLIRKEIEKNLTEQEYSDLRNDVALDQPLVLKHFIELPISQNNQTYYLVVGIVDEGEETSFCYGEIEFKNPEEANAFQAQEFFGLEVTNDLSYKMANYYQKKIENQSMHFLEER